MEGRGRLAPAAEAIGRDLKGCSRVQQQWLVPAGTVRVLRLLRLVHVSVLGLWGPLPEQGPRRCGEDVVGALHHHPANPGHAGLPDRSWQWHDGTWAPGAGGGAEASG